MAFNSTDILAYPIVGNSIGEYIVALVIFVLAIGILKIFKYWVIRKLKKLSYKTKTDLDDFVINSIDKVGWPFYVLLSLYFAMMFIKIPEHIGTFMYYFILLSIIYYAVRILQDVIDYITHKTIQRRREEKGEEDTSVIELLSRILKFSLWLIAALLILSNFYDISVLIAGLGIGGLAIAIALQSVLADIFASFSIYFDKPFKRGDFIIVGNDMGVVKHTGIKTTRLESLWGQEIVISNQELTSSRINNYKKMEKRRIVFKCGVIYETSTEKLKMILKIIKDIFDKIELADLNRVHFKEFGDFSLNFEIVYYVNSSDYNKYMDIQQDINFAIRERFEKEGIEFAYPTQMVFIKKDEQ
ncbi:MAG: mechanosensitive ion channel protein MscS [Candidatus Altiarchaeales archaeon HGW-Altiarchaeales-1]|nr:MAG: mechanosensitive ion channel protein MscS [Candidatus Altiarchaeales archaeon HGW-Altiarchaeales-1]